MQGDVVLGFVVALAVSYGASFLLTPFAGRIGAQFGLVDRPRPGELQSAPVPRSGGYALIAAFLVALGISVALVPRAPEELTRIGGLIVGILVVVQSRLSTTRGGLDRSLSWWDRSVWRSWPSPSDCQLPQWPIHSAE